MFVSFHMKKKLAKKQKILVKLKKCQKRSKIDYESSESKDSDVGDYDSKIKCFL